VTPLSLGIETLGGVMTNMIERNTTIPTRKTETYSTAADGQTQVEIHVLQGERPMASDNRTLGKFHLVGLPPAPRGVPQIEVTFDIDANGIVNVSAKDRATGKSQAITITASSGLAKDEVERMVSDAQSHAEEDKARREATEARNQADTLVYTTEKTLSENRDKLSAGEVEPVEQALAGVKQALEGGDRAAIESATASLTKASHAMAEALYRKAGAGGPATPPADGGAKKNDGDVVDAEVVDKK
jgi:molecular chaperone DnaK